MGEASYALRCACLVCEAKVPLELVLPYPVLRSSSNPVFLPTGFGCGESTRQCQGRDLKRCHRSNPVLRSSLLVDARGGVEVLLHAPRDTQVSLNAPALRDSGPPRGDPRKGVNAIITPSSPSRFFAPSDFPLLRPVCWSERRLSSARGGQATPPEGDTAEPQLLAIVRLAGVDPKLVGAARIFGDSVPLPFGSPLAEPALPETLQHQRRRAPLITPSCMLRALHALRAVSSGAATSGTHNTVTHQHTSDASNNCRSNAVPSGVTQCAASHRSHASAHILARRITSNRCNCG